MEECEYIICCDNININNLLIIIILAAIHIGSVPRWSIVCLRRLVPWESVGGDIKFLRLKQLEAGGVVTDGSVRDTDELINYGFPVFSHSTTPKQGPAAMQPWECNGVMACGGVVVRPGDAIVGDQDGVVVVPAAAAEQVYEIAHGREVIEEVIKTELIENPGTAQCSAARHGTRAAKPVHGHLIPLPH